MDVNNIQAYILYPRKKQRSRCKVF